MKKAFFLLGAIFCLGITVKGQCPVTDTYPYPTSGDAVDPWNFYFRQCTSYCAWKINETAGTKSAPYFFSNQYLVARWGNAYEWMAAAQLAGIVVDTVPKAGAIAYWNAGEGGAGSLGHVAFVESVNTDGSVNVSEYNFCLSDCRNLGTRCGIRATRYIHIKDRAASSTLVAVTTSPLSAGSVGSAYSIKLQAQGGTTPYVWILMSGSLPAGITFSSDGTLAGTPSAAGQSSFRVRVVENGGASVDLDLILTINASSSLSIATASLPQATVGTAYSFSLSAQGGTTPYTWFLLPPVNLPSTMNLSSSGSLSGTATVAAISTLHVRVIDHNGVTADRDFTLTVASSGQSLAITSGSLPQGTVGTAYQANLLAQGGTPSYRWTLASGELPPGLTLFVNGVITGVPSTSGTYAVHLLLTDNVGAQVAADRSLVIQAPLTRIISLTGDLLFDTILTGTSTTKSFTIRNAGTGPVTVQRIDFPPGFSGAWSGTLAAGESHDVSVTFSPTTAKGYGGLIAVISDASAGEEDIPVTGLGSNFLPRVKVTRSGNTVTISWPSSAGSAVLQSSSDIRSASGWGTVGVTPNSINGSFSVTLPASASAQFFRLRTP